MLPFAPLSLPPDFLDFALQGSVLPALLGWPVLERVPPAEQNPILVLLLAAVRLVLVVQERKAFLPPGLLAFSVPSLWARLALELSDRELAQVLLLLVLVKFALPLVVGLAGAQIVVADN